MNAHRRPEQTDGAARHGDGDHAALAAWHAGWAVAAALLAFGVRWIGGVDGPVFYSVLAMVVPGLIGLNLIKHDSFRDRMILLGVWGTAAATTAALSGGLTGPLAGFVFLPLTAGIALGGPRPVQVGALGVGVAAVAGLATSWMLGGPGAHLPALAALSAVLTAAAAALAVRLSWLQRERRLSAAEAEVRRVEGLMAAQPGLTLILEPSGRVLAAYGAPPASLPVDPLFEQGLVAAVHAPGSPAPAGRHGPCTERARRRRHPGAASGAGPSRATGHPPAGRSRRTAPDRAGL